MVFDHSLELFRIFYPLFLVVGDDIVYTSLWERNMKGTGAIAKEIRAHKGCSTGASAARSERGDRMKKTEA